MRDYDGFYFFLLIVHITCDYWMAISLIAHARLYLNSTEKPKGIIAKGIIAVRVITPVAVTLIYRILLG